MKKMSKIVALLLVMMMLLSALASCNEDSGDSGTTSSTPGSAEQSQPSNSLEDWLPDDIDLGRDMNIFVGTLYDEEWMESDDGDLVNTELYHREGRVEKNLGIELTVTTMFGDGPRKTEIMNEIAKRQESTDPNMIADACSTYSQFAGSLTLEGRYQEITASDNIDFEKPWWPDDLLVNSTIDDKVYFVSGDISPTLIYEIYAIYFNIDLLEKYNLENPIDLVNSKDWTIDKLIEMTSGIYDDLDKTTAGLSKGDFVAFELFDAAHYKALPFSMGIRVIEPDDDVGYVWSELYTGGKMDIIMEKVVNWIQSNEGVAVPEKSYPTGSPAFQQQQAIFTLGNFGFAKGELQGKGINFGVVPCPLFDTKQEAYYSYYGNPSSFWGVPTNADIDDACLLLESLAADAYVYISPVIFERALKHKYVTGSVDGLSKMFDIIRNGVVFDACMFYNSHITGYGGFTELGGVATSWSPKFNAFTLRGMNIKLQDVVNGLRKLEQ